MIFRNRFEAGELLAKKLSKYKKNAVVLAIPRGGVEVGYKISKILGIPLEIALSKKIGYPGNEEYAIGAVTLYGEVVDESFQDLRYAKREATRIRRILRERYREYKGSKKMIALKGKTAIIVDDGIATGKTMIAFIKSLRKEKPKKIIVAVPVGPADTVEELKGVCDGVICLSTPGNFYGIGQFYEDFSQVSDEGVKRLLKKCSR